MKYSSTSHLPYPHTCGDDTHTARGFCLALMLSLLFFWLPLVVCVLALFAGMVK